MEINFSHFSCGLLAKRKNVSVSVSVSVSAYSSNCKSPKKTVSDSLTLTVVTTYSCDHLQFWPLTLFHLQLNMLTLNLVHLLPNLNFEDIYLFGVNSFPKYRWKKLSHQAYRNQMWRSGPPQCLPRIPACSEGWRLVRISASHISENIEGSRWAEKSFEMRTVNFFHLCHAGDRRQSSIEWSSMSCS